MPKHSAEAPFACKDCGKAFKWKHALTAHSVIHEPVKKFLCQECGFSTSHVSTFRFHNRIHSGSLTKCDVKNCTFQVRSYFGNKILQKEYKLKYVIVSQSSANCLQIYHLFAFLELQDKLFNLSRNSSFLIGWTTTTKINFQKWAVLAG